MLKRLFDFVVSLIFLLILSPLFLVIAILIKLNSSGTVFFVQKRVGQNNIDFNMFKFRTMKPGSDKLGLLTIGSSDARVTTIGYYLRKFKLDEFPQLLNVALGDMSLVGPRPEVRYYVDQYTEEQLKVLTIKPGITDYASIKFADESNILAKASDHEKEYIEKILPEKLRLNLKYIDEMNFFTDIRILAATLVRIATGG